MGTKKKAAAKKRPTPKKKVLTPKAKGTRNADGSISVSMNADAYKKLQEKGKLTITSVSPDIPNSNPTKFFGYAGGPLGEISDKSRRVTIPAGHGALSFKPNYLLDREVIKLLVDNGILPHHCDDTNQERKLGRDKAHEIRNSLAGYSPKEINLVVAHLLQMLKTAANNRVKIAESSLADYRQEYDTRHREKDALDLISDGMADRLGLL